MKYCPYPFKTIEGLGCIWLYYYNRGHNFEDGAIQCDKRGADMFEMVDFEKQHELLYNYLIDNGGNVFIILNIIFMKFKAF